MKHHAERIERIRALMDAIDKQHVQLAELTENTARLRRQVAHHLKQQVTPVSSSNDRSRAPKKKSAIKR